MKPETYNMLVDKIGVEKTLGILKAQEVEKEKMKLDVQREAERLEERLSRMIPKEQLIAGAYYNGFRFRGSHVAMWDAKAGAFKTIHFTMGDFFVEKLPYFGDVAETNFDGFIPFEIIKPIM